MKENQRLSPTLEKYRDWAFATFGKKSNRVTEEEIRGIFSKNALPDTQLGEITATFNKLIATMAPIKPGQVVRADEQGAVIEIKNDQPTGLALPKNLDMTLILDPQVPEKLMVFTFTEHIEERPPVKNWDDFTKRLKGYAKDVAYVVAKIDPETATCKTYAAKSELNPTRRLPIGSTFKLYVLYTLAEMIPRNHTFAWKEKLEVTDAKKSIPTGDTQTLPEGTRVPVQTLAEKMIAISDNTATDLIIDALGKDNIEDTLVELGNDDPRNKPLLLTRELAILKLMTKEKLQHFIDSDFAHRNQLLYAMSEKPLPTMDDLQDWEIKRGPIAINTIEWFASPNDICKIYAQFLKKRKDSAHFREALRILSLNDGGLFPQNNFWQHIYFKGGSEPGVLNIAYLLERSGSYYAVVVSLADTEKSISNNAIFEIKAAIEYLKNTLTLN